MDTRKRKQDGISEGVKGSRYFSVLFFLLASLSFMTFWPYQPHVTWISESTALVLALLISIGVFFRLRSVGPVKLDLLGCTLVLLAILAAVSAVLQAAAYPTRAIIVIAFLIIATFLSLSVRRLQDAGFRVLPSLAWGLFIGGIAQTLFGFLQIGGALYFYETWTSGLPMWVPRANPLAEASGLIFQKNQLADYLLVSGIAGIFLVCSDRLRKSHFLLFAPFAAFILACTSSRTALLYPVALLAVAFLPSNGRRENLRFRNLAVIFAVMTLTFQILYPSITPLITELSPKAQVSTAVDRLTSDQAGGTLGYRSLLWEQSLELFQENLFFGVGPGNYAIARAELQGQSSFRSIFYRDQKFFNHAHNLFFHWLATYGLLATLTLIAAIAWILWRLLKEDRTPARDFVLASVLIILLHSQLEHPLWFAYFLVVFVSLISSRDLPSVQIRAQKFLPVLATASALMIGVIIYGIRDYSDLIVIVNRTAAVPVTDEEQNTLQRIAKNPLLAGMADIFIVFRTMDQTDSDLERKLQLTEKVVRFRPVEFTLYRRALYLAYAGRPTEALEHLQTAFHLAPSSPKQLAHWFTKVPADPRLSPLGLKIAEYYKLDEKQRLEQAAREKAAAESQ